MTLATIIADCGGGIVFLNEKNELVCIDEIRGVPQHRKAMLHTLAPLKESCNRKARTEVRRAECELDSHWLNRSNASAEASQARRDPTNANEPYNASIRRGVRFPPAKHTRPWLAKI